MCKQTHDLITPYFYHWYSWNSDIFDSFISFQKPDPLDKISNSKKWTRKNDFKVKIPKSKLPVLGFLCPQKFPLWDFMAELGFRCWKKKRTKIVVITTIPNRKKKRGRQIIPKPKSSHKKRFPDIDAFGLHLGRWCLRSTQRFHLKKTSPSQRHRSRLCCHSRPWHRSNLQSLEDDSRDRGLPQKFPRKSR